MCYHPTYNSTHTTVKALKEAGFDADQQAEAAVATVGDVIGGNVAAETDIVASRTATRDDMLNCGPICAALY